MNRYQVLYRVGLGRGVAFVPAENEAAALALVKSWHEDTEVTSIKLDTLQTYEIFRSEKLKEPKS